MLPISSIAGTFTNGVPVAVRKSDWSKNLIFIRMAEPVSHPANCGSDAGLVVYDDIPFDSGCIFFRINSANDRYEVPMLCRRRVQQNYWKCYYLSRL